MATMGENILMIIKNVGEQSEDSKWKYIYIYTHVFLYMCVFLLALAV